MILDLSHLIDSPIKRKYEVIMGIDANEPNNKHNNGVSQLLQLANFLNIVSHKHVLYKEPNTYIRGRHRIN